MPVVCNYAHKVLFSCSTRDDEAESKQNSCNRSHWSPHYLPDQTA